MHAIAVEEGVKERERGSEGLYSTAAVVGAVAAEGAAVNDKCGVGGFDGTAPNAVVALKGAGTDVGIGLATVDSCSAVLRGGRGGGLVV